jgi:dCMP deaminase
VSLNWDKKYLRLALHIAGWSKDPSTKVGAVIVGDTNEVISLGFNGPPRGVEDDVPERWERPLKYQFCEHSERNAVFNAARSGVSTMGATMYMTSFPAKFGPCDNCCRAIIQAGICRVVTEPPRGDIERWKESFKVGQEMLDEAGVEVDQVNICEHSGEKVDNFAAGVQVWECAGCGEVVD